MLITVAEQRCPANFDALAFRYFTWPPGGQIHTVPPGAGPGARAATPMPPAPESPGVSSESASTLEGTASTVAGVSSWRACSGGGAPPGVGGGARRTTGRVLPPGLPVRSSHGIGVRVRFRGSPGRGVSFGSWGGDRSIVVTAAVVLPAARRPAGGKEEVSFPDGGHPKPGASRFSQKIDSCKSTSLIHRAQEISSETCDDRRILRPAAACVRDGRDRDAHACLER